VAFDVCPKIFFVIQSLKISTISAGYCFIGAYGYAGINFAILNIYGQQ
jgi:hypothetical protein